MATHMDDVQRLQVLLVSAVQDDVEALRRLFAESGGAVDVHVLADAGEAIAFLRASGPFEGAARPDLALLDLDVADDSPLALLDALRADPELERLPVIAIVGDHEAAQLEAVEGYRLHEFVRRPLDADLVGQVVSYFNEV
jgi:CheY-like chemotaxis protein